VVRQLVEPEFAGDSVLHLFLAGPAAAGDQLFTLVAA